MTPTPTIPAAAGLADPTLAFNLSSPSDYAASAQFLNIMETARPWIGHMPNRWGGMSDLQLCEGGYLDARGWPTSIPAGFASIGTIWEWGAQPGNAIDNKGTYVLTHEGTGTITVSGNVRIVSSAPGRIVFNNTAGGTFYMNITKTDPAANGDHIRNIVIVAERHLALFEAGQIFNPDWLSLIENARMLRFMDWNNTNNATVVDWADRRVAGMPPGGARAGGVPIEYMVALSNRIGADPWFSMPHTASDGYVTAFAAYVRDTLDPSLTARIEYSNEAWNPSFTQHAWLRTRAKADWGDNSGSAPNVYYVKRATEMARIWNGVFGTQGRSRLVHVLGAQTVNTWLTGEMLRAAQWRKAEPLAWTDPATTFDEMAVTTYFGGATVSDSVLRKELLAILDQPSVDAYAWLAGRLSDPSYRDSVASSITTWRAQKALASKAGLALVSYEGGQHAHHSFAVAGLTESQIARLTTFMTAFVRSEEMGRLYKDHWAAWQTIGDGPYMQFGELGTSSRWGSWGLYTGVSDSTPRAQILEALNDTTKPWWTDETADDTYRHGITLLAGDTGATLTGTGKIDHLIGGAGNDVLIGGGGDDGLHGGGGEDTAVLAGVPRDYTIVAEGRGHRLTGPDGSDLLLDVERLAFADGRVLTIGQMLDPVIKVDPRGMKADADGAPSMVTGADATGVQVGGVNRWSPLGRELGSGNNYTLNVPGATAVIGGRTVGADYWTMQDNLTGQKGEKLSDSATNTALQLGSLIIKAGELTLTEGNDQFSGREPADHINGGGGNDLISGGAGNDTLSGGGGNDTLSGGDGSDLFGIGAGHTRIEDFKAEDRLDLSAFGAWDRLDHGLDAKGHLWVSNGQDRITFIGRKLADLAWIGGRA